MNNVKFSRHTLVVVEDTDEDERLTLRAVAKSGIECDVRVMRDGTEAIFQILSGSRPAPEMILLDIHLPGSSGIDILSELRKHERFSSIPIVMFSSLANDAEVARCFLLGANSFVLKPVDPGGYQSSVQSIIRYWFTVNRIPQGDSVEVVSLPRDKTATEHLEELTSG